MIVTGLGGRLHLFAGIDCYPSGGMDDYLGMYSTLEECLAALPRHRDDAKIILIDWATVNVEGPSGLEDFRWLDIDTSEWKVYGDPSPPK